MQARIVHAAPIVAALMSSAGAQAPVDIGSRLELFVDEALVESTAGELSFLFHRPERREIVFETDAPWEGNASAYQCVLRDGDVYRMYYHVGQYTDGGEATQALEKHPWFLCYAESRDGKRWTRPTVGLFEFDGSTENNIILTPEAVAEIGGDPAHTSTFLDTNPACPPDARIKTLMLGSNPKGLYALGSADGIRFTLLSKDPIITEGYFDSQNLAFWDPIIEAYREYHRDFNGGVEGGVRDIMTATSTDFLHFPAPKWLQYPGAPREHLYTNQIQPYYRAPHILMGFPMRYTERAWSTPLWDLPGREERLARASSARRYGVAVTDALFMTSRDGEVFHRWPEAFIRPGPRDRQSWVYGDNFVFWPMVETAADLPDAPNEISFYATEGYWEGTSTSVRRYALRIDGFVSAHAPLGGGELVTKAMVFDGGSLALNLSTSGAGSVQVELQDLQGQPIEGYSLDDCPELFGDDIRHIVRWKGRGADLRPLAGTPVRLRFRIADADVYSYQFVEYAGEGDYPAELP